MRVLMSWLREFVDVDLPAEELADVLTMGGLTVEAVHRPSAGVRGVVVAEVVSTAAVEGSDKLTLVEASDGTRVLPVLCGAKNFSAGDRVAWAQPGATLPGGVTIGTKPMFGITSNGMLASPRELGLGDDHRGIWVLEPDAPLGAALDEWLDLDDAVLELETTPDRGYALSILGVARDVAAFTGGALTVPSSQPPDGGDTGVPVTIEDPAACLRFDARRIEGLDPTAPSPAWLQRRLAAAGMRSVGAIVDATNHAMLETGHPIHAYDLAAIAGPRIDVRRARTGERFTTLDGIDRALDPQDLVIADADGVVGLAGVMGGTRTEVGQTTNTVLLEVAAFDARAVLRTARRHGVSSEASKRFEKTVPPQTVALGATRCAHLLVALAGGRVTAGTDYLPQPLHQPTIVMATERARRQLGMDLSDDEQADLLRRIGCQVTSGGDGTLKVVPPPHRPDLRIPVDLHEDIARLAGYSNVPERLPATGRAGGRDSAHNATRAVRAAMVGGGWTEVLVPPFVAARDLAALGWADDDPRRAPVALVNPLNDEEAVLRTSLLPGLLRTLRRNANRQVADAAVFEVGRVFRRPTADAPGSGGGPDGVVLPAEPALLGLAGFGRFVVGRHDEAGRPLDLYDLTGALDLVRRVLGLPALVVDATDERPFHPGRAAAVRAQEGGPVLGAVGELHPRVLAALDLPPRTLAGELLLDPLIAAGVQISRPRPPSSLPGLRFDVAVVVAAGVPAADVEAAVRAGAGDRLRTCVLFDVYRGASVGAHEVSLAYALALEDDARQLTDEDQAAAIERIATAVGGVGGKLRR